MKMHPALPFLLLALAGSWGHAEAKKPPRTVTLSVELTVDGVRLRRRANIALPTPSRTAVGPAGTLQIHRLDVMRFVMPDGIRTIDVQPTVVHDPADRKAPYALSDALYNNRKWGTSTTVPSGAPSWSELSKVSQKIVLTAGGTKYRLEQTYYTSCFLGDTRIRVLGGNEVPIRMLADGEYVLNPLTGRPAKIERVIRGPEPYGLFALGVGGRRIVLTRDHPVPTQLGIKAAREVVVGDQVLTEGLRYQAVTAIERLAPVPGTRVYNLRFNSSSPDPADHVVLANGLVMGNQPLQALVERGERPGRLPLPAGTAR